jgi:hypothetical protein
LETHLAKRFDYFYGGLFAGLLFREIGQGGFRWERFIAISHSWSYIAKAKRKEE